MSKSNCDHKLLEFDGWTSQRTKNYKNLMGWTAQRTTDNENLMGRANHGNQILLEFDGLDKPADYRLYKFDGPSGPRDQILLEFDGLDSPGNYRL